MTRRRCVAGVAAAMVLAGCNPKVESSATPTPSPAPTSTGIRLRISGHGTKSQPVRFIQQTGNRHEYDLLAKTFESIGAQGSARVSFNDVHVTFRAKDGSVLTANAPHALLNQVNNTIVMSGGVRARSSAGTTLQCDTLTYEHKTGQIYGSGHVAIASANGGRATAQKFQSDISLTHTRMQ
jgi:hypothetical protein